jgi:peptidyl-prolyl cis-trans isomerase SurA
MKLTLMRYLPLLLAGVFFQAPLTQAATNRVVKTVNTRPILQSEVDDLMHARMIELRRTATSPEEYQAEVAKVRGKVLDLLIDQELILAEFQPLEANFGAKIDAHVDEMIRKQFIGEMFKGDVAAFRKAVEESGMGMKKFREQQRKNIIVEMMRGQFAKVDSPYITEDERTDWLRRNIAKFRIGGRVKFWSITIPGMTREKSPQQQLALAKEIRTSLVNGADFAALARTHSVDSKRDNGGSWGWVERKDMSAQFWPVISKLDAGKISEVTPSEGSFYIFWVEAREEGKMRPKAEVDAAVERGIMAEKRQAASEKWLKQLRRKAVIR